MIGATVQHSCVHIRALVVVDVSFSHFAFSFTNALLLLSRSGGAKEGKNAMTSLSVREATVLLDSFQVSAHVFV